MATRKERALALMQTWCDALLAYQVEEFSTEYLHGSLLCPACHIIHGRCADLAYPLVTLWAQTGREAYLRAAVELVDWTEANLVCEGGGYRNDAGNRWTGITAFSAMSLAEALLHYGDRLDSALRERWLNIFARLCGYMIHFYTVQNPNINYSAGGAALFALAHRLLGGADWLERICAEHAIAHQPGTVDIGVRVEVRNEIMEKVNEVLYESKLIGYPKPFKNKVRTFCQNPGGFVSQENYDNDLAVVNGHSYKDLKSDNTNLSILCSHNFSVPFNQPIAYAQKVGELTNMLGAGHILVQRFGDILDGKRTWPKELSHANVRPTLPDAEAGDITAAMPYRAMINIINFIKAMDHVVPGFAAEETLLYSPELKFYSNRVKMDEALNTNIQGLHCLGDSSGWTRGLMMASVMGVLMGRRIAEEG